MLQDYTVWKLGKLTLDHNGSQANLDHIDDPSRRELHSTSKDQAASGTEK